MYGKGSHAMGEVGVILNFHHAIHAMHMHMQMRDYACVCLGTVFGMSLVLGRGMPFTKGTVA